MKAATALQCSDGFQPPAGIGNASHPATLYARQDAVATRREADNYPSLHLCRELEPLAVFLADEGFGVGGVLGLAVGGVPFDAPAEADGQHAD